MKPPGVAVKRSEPLSSAPPSAPHALAVTDGVVGIAAEAVLTCGRVVPAITFHPADSQDSDRPIETKPPPTSLSECIDLLRAAGVWADRWTSPDLLAQLHQCLKRPVDTIICSALDFDDTLPLQQSVAQEDTEEIIHALTVLTTVMSATRTFLAIDPNAGAADYQRKAAAGPVRIAVQPSSYPQLNPTLLIHALTGRKLHPRHLPTETGVLLLDAVAASGIGRCLLRGEPMIETPIGIADLRGDDAQAQLLSVPVGMGIADIIREAGITVGSFEIRGGSPLRDIQPGNDCVASAGSELALYLIAPQPQTNPAPCIRCGWCVTSCPAHVHPPGLLEAAQFDDPVLAERFGVDGCIECGVCSYVCPSHLPLLGSIRHLRSSIHAHRENA